MIGNFTTIFDIIKNISGWLDSFGKAKDEDRKRIINYFNEIEKCLQSCIEDIEKKRRVVSRWVDLQEYAQDLPKNIAQVIGKAKADKLADLLNKTASYKPEPKNISDLKKAASELNIFINKIEAEPSSTWFPQWVQAMLLLWTIGSLPWLIYLTWNHSVLSQRISNESTIILPANKLWLNTGIQIKPNQKVKITASGAVTLAIHRLVEAAYTHDYPRWNWTDPSGDYGTSRPTPIDKALKELFIEPGLKPGVLLACVTLEKDLGKYNPKPQGIQQIGKDGEFISKEGGTLWLVINDAVLNDNAESAYVLPQKILDETYGIGKVTEKQRKEEWERIKTENYFEAFFDDNAGEFLVQVQIAP